MKSRIAPVTFARRDRTRRRWAPAQPGDELAPMGEFARRQASLAAAVRRSRSTTSGSPRGAHLSWYTRVVSLARHSVS